MEDTVYPQRFKITVISFDSFEERRRFYDICFYFRLRKNHDSTQEIYERIKASYDEIENKIKKRFGRPVLVKKIERIDSYLKPEKSEGIHPDFIIDILD